MYPARVTETRIWVWDNLRMPAPIAPAADLRAALHALAELVDGMTFKLPGNARTARNALRRETAWGINEYLLPRLGDLDAPLVAVLIGSTGSGKSTILNSLAQLPISDAGALRPTTTMPVVWAHGANVDRYREEFLSGYGLQQQPIRVVDGNDSLPRGLTVIDAPDFDSVVEDHRRMADDLLAVGDVILFVTSAQRYADAVPWEFLDKARARSVPVLFIANRTPPLSDVLIADYRRLLEERGFPLERQFFEITEQLVDRTTGALPEKAVGDVLARLEEMASDSGRAAVLEASIRGAVGDLAVRTAALERAVSEELTEAGALRRVAAAAYERQVGEVSGSLDSGELIRAEVLERWQEFLGTGELTKAVSEGFSRLSSWARRVFGGTQSATRVRTDTGMELREVLIRRADLAAAAAASAWELDPAGAALLSGRSLWRHADTTAEAAAGAVDNWLTDLSELISEAGASKKRTAQVASYGVNSVAVAVILGVFLQTGGLTGAEVGVAAGAAAAQQKLLEHLFGSAAARSLVETARLRLSHTVGVVLADDGARFGKLLDDHTDELPEPGSLSSAHDRVVRRVEAWDGV